MPDSEVLSIANWAWSLRLENRVYDGRNSSFRIPRAAFDAVRAVDNGPDALALLAVLHDVHGHRVGEPFPLDFAAMREKGRLNMSIIRFREARRTLEAANVLRLVGKHRAGKRKQTFVLSNHPLAGPPATNAVGLLPVTTPS